ncbi:MAG: hypothetical protein QXU82_02660 [Candidatus Aenigmatarchaeota archaeon]
MWKAVLWLVFLAVVAAAIYNYIGSADVPSAGATGFFAKAGSEVKVLAGQVLGEIVKFVLSGLKAGAMAALNSQ